MPIINKDVQAALNKAIERFGSVAEFCRRTGINSSQVYKYRSGVYQTIKKSAWASLYPHLAPYLDASNDEYHLSIANHGINSGNMIGINHGTINSDCMSAVIDKILDDPELSAEEKVKFVKAVKR